MTNVSETILTQLGGGRFIAMTGARNLLGDGQKFLAMKLGRNAAGITHLRIELRGDDTYDVHLLRVRGATVREMVHGDGIYADGLEQFVADHTGLATRL